MTDREKAIIMAYTGTVMLTGDKLEVFYKYVSEKLGWSIQTIDLLTYADKIKACAKEDFIKLCSDEMESEECKWCKYRK